MEFAFPSGGPCASKRYRPSLPSRRCRGALNALRSFQVNLDSNQIWIRFQLAKEHAKSTVSKVDASATAATAAVLAVLGPAEQPEAGTVLRFLFAFSFALVRT